MIWCLHGFLGRPADWDFLPLPHRAPDLFRGELADPAPQDVLIGYSMGGRLALHQLLRTPVRKAVIISAGIGAHGEERRRSDERWAGRFESEPWPELMEAWHSQPVFGGHHVARDEGDFERAALARALREWSPATLPTLEPQLHRIETPVLWVVGERDQKYVAEGRRAVAALPSAELWICPDAGHRVPWEQPDAFVERLRAWVE